jgi:Glycosyl hydrolases family 35
MLGIISNKFSIGKETYPPFSAELHYFRIDKRYWAICFERIKKAGFRIISTAVPWSVHQDELKRFDFSGHSDSRKDLIVFLELAREFGFKVILRPGPWVAGQLNNGGIPKFVFNDLKAYARDSHGAEIKLPDDYGAKGGHLPSYLHPVYQFHLKNYLKAFIDQTKNYVHPRGPIFLVELDYETSFGRLLNPGSADFNKDVLESHYFPWLESRYGDIKKLNALYKEKHGKFTEVEPPTKFTDLEIKDYPKALDWMAYREYTLNHYLESMEDVFKAYTVEPLLFRSLYFAPSQMLPAFNLVPEDRAPLLGANVFPSGSYFDMAVKARFMNAEYGFAYASSFSSGRAAENPEREEKVAPVTDNARRFYLAAGMACGFRGMNHYMMVDRDRWYGAPLHKDGTVGDGFEMMSRFNQVVSSANLSDPQTGKTIAVVANRLYANIRQLASKKEFTYLPRLVDETMVGLTRDLMRLKAEFAVRENRDFESLNKYKMLIFVTTEVMSQKDQEGIVELAKAGVTIVLVGVMPRYDEQFHECQVLANHFRIKTTVEPQIAPITHKSGTFPAFMYGSIKSTDDAKVKKLVKSDTKLVGISTTRFKGTMYLFTFDIASGGNHQRLAFVESILEGEGIEQRYYCSDPSVDISFQSGEKKGLLYVVAPPAGELSDAFHASKREVIIRVDLKDFCSKTASLKLVDILSPDGAEPIKVTAKELKDGIPLEIRIPDGYIFVVEKR